MLPPTHKALVQEVYAEPLVVKEIATPQPDPGSVVIKIIAVPIISYAREVYNGNRKYSYPTPLVVGTSAIGRVAAVGVDTVKLKEGDLVYTDCVVRGRDDEEAIILTGLADGSTDGSRKLFAQAWKDSTCAEYARVPLENTFALDEARLCGSPDTGGLGYSREQLCWILQALVPYGGLRSIDLQAGETILIAPSTGGFGSAAVVVALAMGARVVAAGRNAEALAKTKALNDRVETVQITGDVEEEVAAIKKAARGNIDAFLDISPPEAQHSTHLKAGIMSLRQAGRVSLMGGLLEDVPFPHRFIMRRNITLKGQWMYSREEILAFLRLVTSGVLNFRDIVKVQGKFALEAWGKAFDVAWESGRLGELVVLTP
ncbi:alcohol dehydrogenase [Neohortaea acidophila]|uniref:Alcohol dehydrogenase n=1 Tax=Neohortaea acidophila TaxID=245834 RepID=A0A6A6PJD4_9PEZI|nr:alcohol dehydrogenase [Neohortaea acidophila]KAF2479821.1 alcohol dehydrogenase [Neohortaea acidophila]